MMHRKTLKSYKIYKLQNQLRKYTSADAINANNADFQGLTKCLLNKFLLSFIDIPVLYRLYGHH